MLISHYIDKINGFAEGIEVLSAYQKSRTASRNLS